jgi:hypothetical protein
MKKGIKVEEEVSNEKDFERVESSGYVLEKEKIIYSRRKSGW